MNKSILNSYMLICKGGEESYAETIDMARYYSKELDNVLVSRTIRNLLDIVNKYYPRVLNADEIKQAFETRATLPVWIEERRDPEKPRFCVGRLIDLLESTDRYVLVSTGHKYDDEYRYAEYNITWRCWTAEPSKSQMEDTKWDEND